MTAGAPATSNGGTPVTPVVDRSVLGEWLAGDDAAINELLIVFRDSVCAEQVRMRETAAAGDLVEYANAAHRLRGAALSMGARALAEAAGKLYAAARAQNGAACLDGLALLDTHILLMMAEVPVAAPAASEG